MLTLSSFYVECDTYHCNNEPAPSIASISFAIEMAYHMPNKSFHVFDGSLS